MSGVLKNALDLLDVEHLGLRPHKDVPIKVLGE
jgi:NAD(P)H-dependent FMN reductase